MPRAFPIEPYPGLRIDALEDLGGESANVTVVVQVNGSVTGFDIDDLGLAVKAYLQGLDPAYDLTAVRQNVVNTTL